MLNQIGKLLASDGAGRDLLVGTSVAISGGIAFVGARLDSESASDAGSAYIFNLQPADLNSDGVVDGLDLSIVLIQFGGPGSADINSDGIVNGVDLAMLLNNLG